MTSLTASGRTGHLAPGTGPGGINGRPGGRRVEALEGRSLLSTAGSPDFTYGFSSATDAINGPTSDTQGLAQVAFEPTSSADANPNFTGAVAVQSNGDAIVVGTTTANGTETAAVTRLNPSGSVDTTFGTDGVALLASLAGSGSARAVAIEPNGQILVATTLSTGSTPEEVVYRLNTDGSLDTTFGTGGYSEFTFMLGANPTDSQPTRLAIAPDGDIIVGGWEDSTPSGLEESVPALARLTPAGALDTTFGTGGQVTPTFANTIYEAGALPSINPSVTGLAVESDGSILFETTAFPTSATNDTVGEIAVGKLTPAGSYDTTFGSGGQVLLGSGDTSGPLALLSSGQVIVTGSSLAVANKTTTIQMDAYRLNADGSLDTTFGTMGEATAATINYPYISYAVTDTVDSVLVEPDGTILVEGQAVVNDPINGSRNGLAVVALNADGSTAINFGTDGEAVLPDAWLGSLTPGSDLGLQPNGELLVATNDGVGRLLASGSSNDFDEDGITDPAVLLPNTTYPVFAFRPSSGGPDILNYFGTAGAGNTLPAPGAYDGSGIDEEAVYLPASGLFAIRPFGSEGSQDRFVAIGATGAGNSIPVPADYAGLGYTQVGVYEPATATFVYSPSNSSTAADVSVPFGMPGAGNSIPVPDDYDGSGHTEIAVYLPSIAAFVYRPYGTTGQDDTVEPFGAPGVGNSIPVPGDYDGSGHTELAVYLPAIGAFAYRPYGTTGNDDQVIPFGIPGAGNSIPVLGDFDGSGHTELAVYMPSLDALAYRPYGTTGQDDQFIFFGATGVGNTVPFNAQGAAYLQAEGGGGGDGNAIMPKGSGWVDFVPTVAGQSKKAQDSIVTPSIAAMNQP